MKQLLVLLAIAGLAACSARKGVPYTEPLARNTAEVQQGEVLFNQYCSPCHPSGTAGLGPALNNKFLPGFAIRYQIRHGLGAMPAFTKDELSNKETKQIAAYLKVLRKLD